MDSEIIIQILKFIGLIILICAVPFFLALLAGGLEKILCRGFGSFNASANSVLVASLLGLIRGLCFSWQRFDFNKFNVTMNFDGPKRLWTDPLGLLSINVPHDVAALLTYLEPWTRILLYVVGAIVAIRAVCDSLVLSIVPIALVAVVFSYVAYVYSALLMTTVIVPITVFVFIFYTYIAALTHKRTLMDENGRLYEEV